MNAENLGEILSERVKDSQAGYIREAVRLRERAEAMEASAKRLEANANKWTCSEGQELIREALHKLEELKVTDIKDIVDGSYYWMSTDCKLNGQPANLNLRCTGTQLRMSVRYQNKWAKMITVCINKTVKVHNHQLDHVLGS